VSLQPGARTLPALPRDPERNTLEHLLPCRHGPWVRKLLHGRRRRGFPFRRPNTPHVSSTEPAQPFYDATHLRGRQIPYEICSGGAFSTPRRSGKGPKRANLGLLSNGDRPGALFWPTCATMMVPPRRVMTSIWRPCGQPGRSPARADAGCERCGCTTNRPGPVRNPIIYPRQGVKKRLADHQPGVMIGDTSEFCPPISTLPIAQAFLSMEPARHSECPLLLRPRST